MGWISPVPFLSLFLSSSCCIFVINSIPYASQIIDVGHLLIPKIPNNQLPEIIIISKLLFYLCWDIQNIEDFCLYLSYFYWFRFLTIWMTILPSLKPKSPIRFYGLMGGHNDMLPVSGHTFISCWVSFFLWEDLGNWVFLSDILLSYLLLAMRRHYTIEIVLSGFFSVFLFEKLNSF